MLKKINAFETMSRENRVAFIQYQAEQIELLKAQNAALQARIDRLEAQLAKNSTTSSQPPSSAGLKKPAPKSHREKGKRRSGGQVGHPGETLEMVTVPAAVAVEREVKQQVFDLPPLRLLVTEPPAQVKCGLPCRGSQRAAFPPEVAAPTQSGANVLAQAVYRHRDQRLPLARLREWFQDGLGQPLSAGTLQRALAVAPALDTIYLGLTRAAVVQLDETGFRIAQRLIW